MYLGNIARLCSVGLADSGQGYGSLTELPEVSGTGTEVLQKSQKFGYMNESLTELREVPGVAARAYRTFRSFGYGYECPTTELTEVSGTGNAQVESPAIGGELDLKLRIYPTCMACSHWANVPEEICAI